ncbi:MAG: DUF547 domain-containing protein [Turneriella sp.]|nr:DUF547 domain-containing protein [Turneriella sp.]
MKKMVLLINTTFALFAAEPDYAAWDALLRRHVYSGVRDGIRTHLVRYKDLARDPDWPRARKSITEFDPKNLKGRSERIAFWINAYNIAAIAKVLEQYPTASITARGDRVWQEPALTIAGQSYSLDAIEHKILRPMLEPRIHFAIVCASLSCPDLRREAYRAQKLERQLSEQTKSFLANTSKGLRHENGVIYHSAIFSWFAQDFGPLEQFFARYGYPTPAGEYREMPYNWSLNE